MKIIKMMLMFLLLLCSSVNSRELNDTEKLVISSLSRTSDVKMFMENNIKKEQLSWEEFFQFKIYQASCTPLDLALYYIKNSAEELEDQTKKLALLYHGCSEGTLSLADMYRLQQ